VSITPSAVVICPIRRAPMVLWILNSIINTSQINLGGVQCVLNEEYLLQGAQEPESLISAFEQLIL
jgi:hypothetical protein